MTSSSIVRIVGLTALTLIAFAANSVLCRLALSTDAIDPVSFTALRLASGALVLLPFLRTTYGARHMSSAPATYGARHMSSAPAAGADDMCLAPYVQQRGRWSPAAAGALLVYALGFSLAYVWLDTGTGALLLFGAVQVTMIGAGLRAGERPTRLRTLGIAAAIVGVTALVAPGVTAPEPLGALLMVGAGVAWGIYSLLGRGVPAPTQATARNFLLATPIGLAALLLAPSPLVLTARGAALAVASGAVTSGLGYVIWYAALRGHSATSAAVVQLAVPVLAALGGVTFLGEEPTTRLAAAGTLTLGGVLLAVLARRKAPGGGHPGS